MRMKSDIKKQPMFRYFGFTVQERRRSQILIRTGIPWHVLLGTLISAPYLRQAYWAELQELCTLYPRLVDTHRRKIDAKSMAVPQYNYIAPEGKWIEHINL